MLAVVKRLPRRIQLRAFHGFVKAANPLVQQIGLGIHLTLDQVGFLVAETELIDVFELQI